MLIKPRLAFKMAKAFTVIPINPFMVQSSIHLYRCGFHLCRLAGTGTPVSRRIFVFLVDYTTEPLVMQANFARTFRKIQAGRDFLPACCYTSMVLASRRWDCVYRMMLSPSLRTRSPLGIRMLPFRRTMTMMVWREMSSSRMGRPFQGF